MVYTDAYQIRIGDGSRRDVMGKIFGSLGLHKEYRWYTITHIKTGFSVMTIERSYKEMVSLIKRLNDNFKWDKLDNNGFGFRPDEINELRSIREEYGV